MIYGRLLLSQSLTKLIGNGESIRVWCDPWLGDDQPMIPLMKNIFIDLNLKVSDLLLRSSGSWNVPILKELFYQQNIDIMLRKKPIVSHNIYWIWKYNRCGEYSVKSGN